MFEVWELLHGHGRPVGIYASIEDAIGVRSMMTEEAAADGRCFRIWDVERGCFVHPDSELELAESGML